MGFLNTGWDLVKGSFDFDPATPGIFGSAETGGISTTADFLGGLYQTYTQSRQPTRMAPPAPLTIAPTGATPRALPPYLNEQTRRVTTVGCISQRDIDIAAAAGTSPEMVDLVLRLGRRNRRRKRMLTKSDIGDISTMRQILGGGKAFELWLAKATR